eukprot:1442622-Pyramimonas_sp.AAC.1
MHSTPITIHPITVEVGGRIIIPQPGSLARYPTAHNPNARNPKGPNPNARNPKGQNPNKSAKGGTQVGGGI